MSWLGVELLNMLVRGGATGWLGVELLNMLVRGVAIEHAG